MVKAAPSHRLEAHSFLSFQEADQFRQEDELLRKNVEVQFLKLQIEMLKSWSRILSIVPCSMVMSSSSIMAKHFLPNFFWTLQLGKGQK